MTEFGSNRLVLDTPCACVCVVMKPVGGKSREELALEKRRELERRLQDVSGQLNSVKKPQKPKGKN